MTLKFMAQPVLSALGDVEQNQELELTLTGALWDGTPFQGTDCVVIRGQVQKPLANKTRWGNVKQLYR
jgi:hypothetical protein